MRNRKHALKFYGGIILLFVMACSHKEEVKLETKLANQFSVLLQEADRNLDVKQNYEQQRFFPRSLDISGNIEFVASGDWCSGFFPGSLWLLYDLTDDVNWEEPAQKYSLLLEREQWNGKTHDMGFKIMSSYGNAYRYTGDKAYSDVMIQSAKTLLTRYNPIVGAIRSWDHNSDQWTFPVIIDNMMNLELLFEAAELTQEAEYYEVAVKHANTTLKEHFREDNSSYHVVDFNPETGAVNERVTHQGDSDDSAWARGQAWGLYGYTMCYRYTKDSTYLRQAVRIADFIFSHTNLPEDKIPIWDFNYSADSGEPRDVSAAAITASALFELSEYAGLRENEFVRLATGIMDSLIGNYALSNGLKGGFLLDHSVGHKPRNGEVDVPIIYADYYFLEALLRQRKISDNVNQ
jgi:hypothetical protein